MKQTRMHRTEREGAGRCGGSGHLPVGVVLCVFLCVLGFLIIGRVQAAAAEAEGPLPQLSVQRALSTADSDELLRAITASVYRKLDSTRELYGLTGLAHADVLEESALYAVSRVLQAPYVPTPEQAQAEVNAVMAELPYVQAFAAVYAEGFFCTSAEAGATHLCKIVLNDMTRQRAVLRSDLRSVGVAVASCERDGQTVLCAVICASTRGQIYTMDSRVPSPLYEKDTTPPAVRARDGGIFLLRGEPLTEQAIRDALIVEDERGETPTLRYDPQSIDSGRVGVQQLRVEVSDRAGNTAPVTLSVHVADKTAPQIWTQEIVLPEIPAGTLWDLGKYIEALDACGIADIRTDPIFAASSALSASSEADAPADGLTAVRVTVTGVLGGETTAVLPVRISDVQYVVRWQDETGAQLTVSTEPGAPLTVGAHVLLRCGNAENAENAVYRFTVTAENGVRRSFLRKDPVLVWNPHDPGTVRVRAAVLDGDTGAELAVSQLELTVLPKTVRAYTAPTLSFPPESGIVLDRDRRLLYGLTPELTLAGLTDAAEILGGSGEATLAGAKTSGDALTEADVLGTGMTVSLVDQGTEYGTYTVLVFGDTNGNGRTDIGDFAMLQQELLHSGTMQGVRALAADVNRTGFIDIGDFAMMQQCLLGKMDIAQGK